MARDKKSSKAILHSPAYFIAQVVATSGAGDKAEATIKLKPDQAEAMRNNGVEVKGGKPRDTSKFTYRNAVSPSYTFNNAQLNVGAGDHVRVSFAEVAEGKMLNIEPSVAQGGYKPGKAGYTAKPFSELIVQSKAEIIEEPQVSSRIEEAARFLQGTARKGLPSVS